MGQGYDSSIDLSLLLPGKLVCSIQDIRFEGAAVAAPMLLEFPMQVRDSKRFRRGHSELSIDYIQWHGRPILDLFGFEQLYAIFARGLPIRVTLLFNGHRILIGIWKQRIESVIKLLTIIEKARFVAKACDVNPPLPAGLTGVHAAQVEMLHALLTRGEHRWPASQGHFSFAVRAATLNLGNWLVSGDNISIEGRIPELFPFLNAKLELELSRVQFTRPRLDSSLDELRRMKISAGDGNVEIRYLGTEKSAIVRRIPAAGWRGPEGSDVAGRASPPLSFTASPRPAGARRRSRR